jgi:lipopolysaccharide/colanic/teichoic acid biosynthesis glycosyltransferase
MKRIFDLFFSLIALSIFSIPMISIALIIKIFYRHPVVFYQERIGKDKKPFCIYKFQTLVNEKPTKLGKFLRKTGLDELAQFINVLKGDMSIVGPRAITSYDINRLGWNTDYYSLRWGIKPGISGFAQIFGGQHKKTSWFWDKKYVQNNNLLIDFIIILLSFLMNLFGKTRIRQMIWTDKHLK